MPKIVKPLTDTKIRIAKPKDKQYRLSDGGGLYLLVKPKPSGSKLWRFDYTRPSGGRNTLGLGEYTDTDSGVSLVDARKEREKLKTLLKQSLDPAEIRKTNQEDTFEPIALEWIEKKSDSWSDSHKETTLARAKNNLFPWLGTRPIKEITPPELLSVLRRIESRGAVETEHRCKSIAGQVFRYAIATGRADCDISVDLRGALREVIPTPHPALRPGRNW